MIFLHLSRVKQQPLFIDFPTGNGMLRAFSPKYHIHNTAAHIPVIPWTCPCSFPSVLIHIRLHRLVHIMDHFPQLPVIPCNGARQLVNPKIKAPIAQILIQIRDKEKHRTSGYKKIKIRSYTVDGTLFQGRSVKKLG